MMSWLPTPGACQIRGVGQTIGGRFTGVYTMV
jgi:hypothetical protein